MEIHQKVGEIIQSGPKVLKEGHTEQSGEPCCLRGYDLVSVKVSLFQSISNSFHHVTVILKIVILVLQCSCLQFHFAKPSGAPALCSITFRPPPLVFLLVFPNTFLYSSYVFAKISSGLNYRA